MRNTGDSLWFDLSGTPSHTPAWQAINAVDLRMPAQRRGTEPFVVPGAAGGVALPLRAKATERIIDVQVLGLWTPDGDRWANEWDGIRSNLDTLRSSWGNLPGTADSTRTLTLHSRIGTAAPTTTSGPVQVIDFAWTHDQMPVRSVLSLRLLIPAGELA